MRDGPKTREHLIHLLTEAAELEHNLLCSYIYAAASLKTPQDGLSPREGDAVSRWRKLIMSIAVEEMTHLAIANNLLVAIGGVARFDRPNFPVAEGYHPARITIRLERFNRSTLQHFIFLERPPDSDVLDSPDYLPAEKYARTTAAFGTTPSTPDYETIGEFYADIKKLIHDLSSVIGSQLFVAFDPTRQLAPPLVELPGLSVIHDLASALAAIDTIVDQGEGASRHDDEESHFGRFRKIQSEWLSYDPHFDPAFPSATNPVLRKPVVDARDRVWITDPQSADILDLANAVYGLMLNCLEQSHSPYADTDRKPYIDAALSLMHGVIVLADHLARLPAGGHHPEACAGMTFVVPRNLGPRDPRHARTLLSERARHLRSRAANVAPMGEKFIAQAEVSLDQ